MSTQKAVSANVFRKKGGITVLHGGNVDTNLITDSITFAENTPRVLRAGSKVVLPTGATGSSGNIGTIKPLSGGTFAYVNNTTFVAKIIGDEISGVSSSLLTSGASDVSHKRPINFSENNRRYDITDWSYVSGVPTLGGNQGATIDFTSAMGNDDAARPTSANPGEISFADGSPNPIQDSFKPRTHS